MTGVNVVVLKPVKIIFFSTEGSAWDFYMLKVGTCCRYSVDKTKCLACFFSDLDLRLFEIVTTFQWTCKPYKEHVGIPFWEENCLRCFTRRRWWNRMWAYIQTLLSRAWPVPTCNCTEIRIFLKRRTFRMWQISLLSAICTLSRGIQPAWDSCHLIASLHLHREISY
jgi:hypothetical protein